MAATALEAGLQAWQRRRGPAQSNFGADRPGAITKRSRELAQKSGAECIADIPGCEGCRAVRLPAGRSPHTSSVLLLTERGDARAVVRIALATGGDEDVEVEGTWLKRLEGVSSLEGQVPKLLGEGLALNGRRYVMTSPPPGRRSTQLLLPAHMRFLSRLAASSLRHSSFTASPCFHSLESNLDQLEHVLDHSTLVVLQAAMRDCWLSLSRWAGPFVISHGDFSPSNVALQRGGIFVSNWMQARTGANPLADVLHYLLVARIFTRRGVSTKQFRGALRRAAAAARELYPGHWWDERVVSALGLAYLLEKVLAGAKIDRAIDVSNPLTSGYLRLLEERAQWLSS